MNKSFLKKTAYRHAGLFGILLCIIPVSLSAQETTDTPATEPNAEEPQIVTKTVITEQASEELLNKAVSQIEALNKDTETKLIQNFTSQTIGLNKRIDSIKEDTASHVEKLSLEQNEQNKLLNILLDHMDSTEDKLSREIIANSVSRKPQPPKEEKAVSPYPMLSAIFALVASLIGIFLIWQNTHSKSGADPLLESVNKSIKDLKKLIANVEASSDSGSGKTYATAPVSTDNGSNQKVEATLKAVVKKLENLEGNIEAIKETSKEQVQLMETPDEPNPLWPWLFDKGNPLEGWKDRLVEGMNNKQKTAFDLYIALLEASQNLNSKERVSQDTANEIINKVATNLYLHLYEKEDLVTDDLIDLPTQWIKAIRTLVEPALPSLEIKAVYPGDSLNSDTMDKIGGGSQLKIQKPYSWVISDKADGTVRVLTRAKVTTA
jgi:hypothetical protein